ncbi:MAG: MFS transporter [Chitinophagaceae bacterium BSSC1]|nr:MAG: MFS transporter [Chitinophagaceae bacterium BSSC1]
MNIKLRLLILNFLEFFCWGSWLLSIGAYMVTNLKFSGVEVGSVYATLGIASVFIPPIIGLISDRWVGAEKVLGILHLLLSALFIILSYTSSYGNFYLIALLVSSAYMPTLALNNSISYYNLETKGFDPIKHFPPVRVWGTVGFIIAAWIIDLLGFNITSGQFYLASVSSLILGLYSFTLPKVPTNKLTNKTMLQRFGLDAFVLFRQKPLKIFFIFSILLGASLQVTNIWGVPFLNDFNMAYPDSFAVKHSVFLMSISQLSEVFFILLIPYFFKRFGIKIVVMMSMTAWVFRFALFGFGAPEGLGLFFLILSMFIYGMAFDFYFISGSLFVNNSADSKIRSSAQGLFMMMVNGIGAVIGAYGSGFIVDFYTKNEIKDWHSIWLTFALYALIICIGFALLFKQTKHKIVFNQSKNLNK